MISMKRFIALNEYLREQIEKKMMLDNFMKKPPLLNKYIGLENIDGDLVLWYNDTDDELDCWVLIHFFELYYTEYKREQVLDMFIETIKNKNK